MHHRYHLFFDNGTVTPTTVNPLPTFTFTVSPGPQTGGFLVDILIPNNVLNAASLSFSISGTMAGATDSSSIGPDAATLKGDWTSGGLDTFLGLTLSNGSPKNDITAWLPYTQANGDSGATGYEVYQVDLGTNELQKPGTGTAPVLTLSGSNLPIASLLTGFLEKGTTGDYISDANSGAIFEADGPVGPTCPGHVNPSVWHRGAWPRDAAEKEVSQRVECAFSCSNRWASDSADCLLMAPK